MPVFEFPHHFGSSLSWLFQAAFKCLIALSDGSRFLLILKEKESGQEVSHLLTSGHFQGLLISNQNNCQLTMSSHHLYNCFGLSIARCSICRLISCI